MKANSQKHRKRKDQDIQIRKYLLNTNEGSNENEFHLAEWMTKRIQTINILLPTTDAVENQRHK